MYILYDSFVDKCWHLLNSCHLVSVCGWRGVGVYEVHRVHLLITLIATNISYNQVKADWRNSASVFYSTQKNPSNESSTKAGHTGGGAASSISPPTSPPTGARRTQYSTSTWAARWMAAPKKASGVSATNAAPPAPRGPLWRTYSNGEKSSKTGFVNLSIIFCKWMRQ